MNKSFLSVKIAVSLLLIGYLTNTSIFADDYEITFPILLDAQNIPYNQLPQQGQTIIGNGSVGWNNDFYSGAFTQSSNGQVTSHISGLDNAGNILTPIKLPYVCVSPRKNGKSISKMTYTYPYNRESFYGKGPLPLIERPLWNGNIGEDFGFMRLMYQSMLINTQILDVICSDSKDWYGSIPQVHINDTLTYKIQYPVGTNISVKSYRIMPTKKLTILSNYSNTEGSGGFLQVPWQIDPCGATGSLCTSDRIIATSLSGKIFDLKKDWNFFRKNHPESEYFPISSDTESIVFHITKKQE